MVYLKVLDHKEEALLKWERCSRSLIELYRSLGKMVPVIRNTLLKLQNCMHSGKRNMGCNAKGVCSTLESSSSVRIISIMVSKNVDRKGLMCWRCMQRGG